VIVQKSEIEKLNRYFRRVFGNPHIAVRPRPKLNDSAELYVGEEFLGIVSKIEDEGETSYDLSMSILDIDLDD
jgi:Holliday junction resolvase